MAKQRSGWHTQAAQTLGGPDAVDAMINHRGATAICSRPSRGAERPDLPMSEHSV
jgi:hypothetical protein